MTSSRNFSSGLDPDTLEGLKSLQDESDPHFFTQYLKLFIQPIPMRVLAIEAAVGTKDLVVLRGEAHALKSSCANTGAMKMSAISSDLEKVARGELPFEQAASLYQELKEEFAVVRAAVTKLINP